MKSHDLVQIYKQDPIVLGIAEELHPSIGKNIAIKGLSGSLDAVIAAAIYNIDKHTSIFVMQDKEEAAYFQNDLVNLLPYKEIFLYPSSYKRPYSFEETENANILMRAEILNRIIHKAST
ncbi:MAG: transcription-repair coupling factor, partial [Cyclobacteriaceae bacterium]|nr:transcription-repair coupling factor [Cyclobacteriaceae bacterium]